MPEYVREIGESALQIGDDFVIVHNVTNGAVSFKRFNYNTGQWEDVIDYNQISEILSALPKVGTNVKVMFGDNGEFEVSFDGTNYVIANGDNKYIFEQGINRSIGKIGNKVDSGDVDLLPIGLNNNYIKFTILEVSSDERDILPMAVYMDIGGTLGSTETVTILVKAVFDNDDEVEIASLSKTGATGSATVGMETIMTNLLNNIRANNLNINGRRIVKITAEVASSNTSSTTASATVRCIGSIS